MIATTRRTRDELLRRWRAASEAAEHGMSTAEYAVGSLVAQLTALDHLLGDGGFHLGRLASTVTDHGMLDPLG